MAKLLTMLIEAPRWNRSAYKYQLRLLRRVHDNTHRQTRLSCARAATLRPAASKTSPRMRSMTGVGNAVKTSSTAIASGTETTTPSSCCHPESAAAVELPSSRSTVPPVRRGPTFVASTELTLQAAWYRRRAVTALGSLRMVMPLVQALMRTLFLSVCFAS